MPECSSTFPSILSKNRISGKHSAQLTYPQTDTRLQTHGNKTSISIGNLLHMQFIPFQCQYLHCTMYLQQSKSSPFSPHTLRMAEEDFTYTKSNMGLSTQWSPRRPDIVSQVLKTSSFHSLTQSTLAIRASTKGNNLRPKLLASIHEENQEHQNNITPSPGAAPYVRFRSGQFHALPSSIQTPGSSRKK